MFIDQLPYVIPSDSLKNQFNYSAINEFYVVALQLQGMAFYTQSVNLPSITMAGMPNSFDSPFNRIPLTGTKLDYDDLQFKFLINENFQNYIDVDDWMHGITFPQDNQQFIDRVAMNKSLLPGTKNVELSLKSDIHVVALNSNRQPIIIVEYRDAFPIFLSEQEWTSTDDNMGYFSATVRFKYLNRKIIKIT